MSTIPWLPPLNNPHRPSKTTVEIHHFIPRCSDQSPHPVVSAVPVLHLFAFADFESDCQDMSTRQKLFPGLQNYWNLEKPSIRSVNYAVTTSLPSIESDENRIMFLKKHSDEEEFSSPEPISSGGHELFYKISDFMRDAVTRTGHGRNVVFNMFIRMVIVVPDDELRSWHSWFDAKVASDPDFKIEFGQALKRPRTIEELLDEDVKPTRRSGSGCRFEVVEVAGASAQSCSICLDEFPAGSKVIKLLCGHMFDESCVRKWLQENHVCPICRFDVLNAAIDD